MQLYPASYRSPVPPEVTARPSPWPLLLGSVIMLGIAIAPVLSSLGYYELDGDTIPWWLSGWIAFWFGLMGLLGLRSLRAALHPHSWLLQVLPDGLLLRFRYYQNYHHDPDASAVVFLPWRDMASARQVRGWQASGMDDNNTPVRRTMLEVMLQPRAGARQLDSLREAMRAEAGNTKKGRWGKAPAILRDDGRLRIFWEARPAISRVLEAIRGRVAVLEPVDETREGPPLRQFRKREAPTAEEEALLQDAIARGHTIAAIKLARELFGMGLHEAKKYVEDIAKQQRP